jgi:hypothetical protein
MIPSAIKHADITKQNPFRHFRGLPLLFLVVDTERFFWNPVNMFFSSFFCVLHISEMYSSDNSFCSWSEMV